MKQFDFDRYSPPGRPLSVFWAIVLVLFLSEVIGGMSFLAELAENVVLLNGDRYQQLSAVTDFAELMDGRLTALPIAIVAMAAMAVINYSAFYQNSKSIYLMRRLPDRWELARRTVALPAMACAVFLLTAVLLFAIDLGAYRWAMSPRYWPEDWLEAVKNLSIFGV